MTHFRGSDYYDSLRTIDVVQPDPFDHSRCAFIHNVTSGGIYLDKPTTIALIAHLQDQVDACPDRPLHPMLVMFQDRIMPDAYRNRVKEINDRLYELDALKAEASR